MSSPNSQQIKWFLIINIILSAVSYSLIDQQHFEGLFFIHILYMVIIFKQFFWGGLLGFASDLSDEVPDCLLFSSYGVIFPLLFTMGEPYFGFEKTFLLVAIPGFFTPLFHSYIYELLKR